jgi:hypothetical protein
MTRRDSMRDLPSDHTKDVANLVVRCTAARPDPPTRRPMRTPTGAARACLTVFGSASQIRTYAADSTPRGGRAASAVTGVAATSSCRGTF